MKGRKCVDKNCRDSDKITFDRRSMRAHYFRDHGRNSVIKLCQQYNIVPNPYIEPTFILCRKLTEISGVRQ